MVLKRQGRKVSDTQEHVTGMVDMEPVVTASCSPHEGLVRLRALLAQSRENDAEADETAYEALRSVTWQFVHGRSGGGEVQAWADVVLRIRQLLRVRGSQVAERLTALYDLMDQTIRFQGNSQLRHATTRKHVAKILSLIRIQGGPVRRTELASATGLKNANLSRILSQLASEGLVRRTHSAREILVSLTQAGQVLAMSEAGEATTTGMTQVPLATASVQGAAARMVVADLWSSTGCGMAVWGRQGALLSCDQSFAALFEASDPGRLEGIPKEILAKRFGEAEGLSEPGAREVTTGDGRVLRVVACEGGQGSLWLMIDVTAYREALDAQDVRGRALLRKAEAAHRPESGTSHDVDQAARWIMHVLADKGPGLVGSINAINGYAELMRMNAFGLLGNELYGRYANEIAVRSNHAHSMLSNLLVIGDLLHDQASTAISIVPRQVIADVLRQTHERVHAHRIAIRLDSGAVDLVPVSEKLLKTVVLEMVNVVMETSSYGTKVDIGARFVGHKLIIHAKTGNGSTTKPYGASYASFLEGLVRASGGVFRLATGKDGRMATIVTLPVTTGHRTSR